MKQWDFLQNAFAAGRAAHAYLLSGPEEAGVKNFVREFTKSLFCQYYKSNDREICSINDGKENSERKICPNCRLVSQGNFPDVMVVKSAQSISSIENEKDMMEISVEQIRQTQDFLALTPYYGAWKIVIIEDAERMTTNAQHCFLKSLEEPKGHAVIFLETSKPEMLLRTIASRCQELKFFYGGRYEISPDEEKNFRGLERVLGAGIAEKFQYAKNANIEQGQFYGILHFLRKYFRHMLLETIASNTPAIVAIKKKLTSIEDIHQQAVVSNINYKLALEVLLLEL